MLKKRIEKTLKTIQNRIIKFELEEEEKLKVKIITLLL
jgi:hypothetical protein